MFALIADLIVWGLVIIAALIVLFLWLVKKAYEG